MTPDANDLCVFAVKRGDIAKRIDINYNLPKYILLEHKLREKFGGNLQPLGKIADVICGPFGSAIKNNDYQEDGVPLIRITNISKDGYMNYEDLIYISEELGNSLSRTQVRAGDIVISQRGSLGQCAVVDNHFEKLNISANIIAVKNIREYSSTFIHDYLLSVVGQTLLERNISGQVQQKITTQDIADILIPIGCDEKHLSSLMIRGYKNYIDQLSQANYVLDQTKSSVFEECGIHFKDYTPNLCSFCKLKDLLEMGIYCNPHSNYLNEVFSELHKNKFYADNLENFVEINPATSRKEVQDTTLVSFVPMPSVEEKTNNVAYEIKQYKEVKTGFTIFQKDDLLWAKITPCMQNGKSFIASNMPTQIGFGSTEFHVLRKKDERIYMPYLWVILSDSHILEAAQGMFSGSAGQQRVSDAFLKKFPIILPPIEKQKELADNVLEALEVNRYTKEKAEQEWQAAKEQFEKELLGE